MKRFTMLMATFLCLSINVHAQDFKKVVELVDEIEASLRGMIAQEALQRKSEVVDLREQLGMLQSSSCPIGDSASGPSPTRGFEARLASLEAASRSYRPSPDVRFLSNELSALITDLKKSIAENRNSEVNTALPQPWSSIQVGGQLFGFFSYTSSGIEGSGFNRFDLDRTYLTVKGKAFEGARVQLTTDLYRNAAPASYYSGLSLRVKYAMLDYSPSATISIKAGMIPTVWPGFVEGVWKYRGIQNSATDRAGLMSTADLGVSVSYLTPDKSYELAGFILDGAGYTAAETNRLKDYGFRVSMYPFSDTPFLKEFLLAGYAYQGANMSSSSQALQRDRFGGLVSFSSSGVTASAEYDISEDALSNPDTTRTGNVVSVFGEFRAPFQELKNSLSLVWRCDVIDPDFDKGGDMTRLFLLGAAYKANDNLTLVLDHQSVYAETPSLKRNDGTKTGYDGRSFIHLILNF